MNWKVESLDQIPAVAEAILEQLDEKIILFQGEMGAGKTTLIKALCEAKGVQDEVNSPTFSIVNQYQSAEGEDLYHFDFYRIEDEEEAYDFGYEEYFFSGSICFVEWPEKIVNLLPSKFGLVQVVHNDHERQISFQPSATQLTA